MLVNASIFRGRTARLFDTVAPTSNTSAVARTDPNQVWLPSSPLPVADHHSGEREGEPHVGANDGDAGSEPVALTLGHSTRPLAEFMGLLKAHSVARLIDVRTVPRSRHNPHFDRDALPTALAADGIGYEHVAGLGGFRRTHPGSLNTGWRNASFRGYADYMQTAAFAEHLADLIAKATRERVVLMCAEAVPWRCHRSLIADALVVHGIHVAEIINRTRCQVHALTSFAQVHGTIITYPPSAASSLTSRSEE